MTAPQQPSSERADIRPAVAADAPAVTALMLAAYGKYVARIGKPPAPMLADYAALIARGLVWALADGAALRGALVMEPQDGALFIENIAVAPNAQGQGSGRALMAFAEEQARMLGLFSITLYTNEAMTENLAFYARLGFVEEARREEDGYHRVFLRKTLV